MRLATRAPLPSPQRGVRRGAEAVLGLGAVTAERAMKGTAATGNTKRRRRGRVASPAVILAIVLALALTSTSVAGSARTERVSVSPSGEPGDRNSAYAAVSADGRYVAFWSDATNLVPGDTNRRADVFVRDRILGTTEKASVSSTGRQTNADSFGRPAISADGRYVAFASAASNLVPGDTNGDPDVFVRDRKLGTTERVSISATGREGDDDSWEPAISADGRYVAFTSKASNLDSRGTYFHDVFVRDRKLDTTKRVSVSSTGRRGRRPSYAPSISASGRYVAFGSQATNLVPRDTNDEPDVFVRDLKRHKTKRVSVSSKGRQGDRPSGFPEPGSVISANGRYVAFASSASNLAPRDTGREDVFVRDRKRHKTRRVSVSSTGHEGDRPSYQPSISATGRYVAFTSGASNLVAGDTNREPDVFLRDRKRDKTR